jgi:hypothetical protein
MGEARGIGKERQKPSSVTTGFLASAAWPGDHWSPAPVRRDRSGISRLTGPAKAGSEWRKAKAMRLWPRPRSQETEARLIAYLLPPTGKGKLLHTVIIVDGQTTVAHRPLPYGASIPDGADPAVRGLGYRRLDDWAQSQDWWQCPAEPLV